MAPEAQLLFRVQARRGEVISTWLLHFSPFTGVISHFVFTPTLSEGWRSVNAQHEKTIARRNVAVNKTSAAWRLVCLIAGFLFCFLSVTLQKDWFNPMALILSGLGNEAAVPWQLLIACPRSWQRKDKHGGERMVMDEDGHGAGRGQRPWGHEHGGNRELYFNLTSSWVIKHHEYRIKFLMRQNRVFPLKAATLQLFSFCQFPPYT